jgi:hypothetical protein
MRPEYEVWMSFKNSYARCRVQCVVKRIRSLDVSTQLAHSSPACTLLQQRLRNVKESIYNCLVWGMLYWTPYPTHSSLTNFYCSVLEGTIDLFASSNNVLPPMEEE